jgi:hypothetical protein
MGAAPLPQQAGFYTQPPSGAFYSQNTGQPHGSVPGHDASPVGPFNNTQPPISPQYSQANQNAAPNVASTVPQAAQGPVPQFGGPLFDPSDPALFNFDISSLNFGNHYGALEMGMLGHMSSGAADAPAKEKNMMNTLSRAASLYNQQMQYGENAVPAAIGYDQNGIPGSDWNAHHSRQGSMQMQTPNNTPIASNVDQGSLRHDSLHGPQAFVIGQGPASISSASPASTEVNVPYDTDNAMSGTQFFHNGQHQVHQNSVMSSRIPQENRMPGTALQPIPSNVIRKRRRDTKFIYEGIRNPHDYVFAFHRMRNLIERRYPKPAVHRIRTSMMKYRPSLITAAGQLNREDLIHQEQALQLSVIQIEESFSEVGVPSVVCRRSGEVVWMNKEFSILTGWERDVLLGRRPNLNVNTGMAPDPHSSDSTRATTTPVIAGQQDPNSNGTGGNYPVLIVELMDTRSAVEYLDDFADVAYLNTRGTPRRRVNMLRYMTKEDMARAEQENSGATNVRGSRQDLLKLDGNVSHLGEAAMARLGKNGLVDCMIQWQVKRDNFNMPMLVCMHVSLASVNVMNCVLILHFRSCLFWIRSLSVLLSRWRERTEKAQICPNVCAPSRVLYAARSSEAAALRSSRPLECVMRLSRPILLALACMGPKCVKT